MRTHTNLWLFTLTLPTSAAELVADALGEEAVAVSVFAPPRHDTARVEAIYDFEPVASEMAAKLEILSAVFGIAPPVFELKPSPPLDWLKKWQRIFPR